MEDINDLNDKLHILLADDDEDDRHFFIEAVKDLNLLATVTVVNDGAQLMNYLTKNNLKPPMFIFLDINMPGKSGVKVLQEIKGNKDFKDIPVAMYSTSSSPVDIENAFTSGANAFIKKPSDFGVLKKVITKAVSTKWLRPDSGLTRKNFLFHI